jgi:multiple sugar transport system ATP-binding protein
MTVEDNLAFSLQLHKVSKADQQQRVAEVARMLSLEPFLKRKPAALSGGQRQRVAMGRAIVRDPQAFLMDEPLSNLDAKLRVSTRAQLAALHDRLGVTTVYVTHDQIEAMTLGTRVAVLKDGQLQQVDTPQMLFDAPTNLFVATFMGSPSMNLAEARLVNNGGPAVTFADYKLPVPEQAIATHPGLERFWDQKVIVGLRPSSLEDAAFAPPSWPQLKAEVGVTEQLGSEVDVIFPVRTPPVEHEVMTVQFDKAATHKDPPASTTTRPAAWSARGRACGPPNSTPRPAPDGAAPSTWPSTPRPCTGSTPTAAKPSPGRPPAIDQVAPRTPPCHTPSPDSPAGRSFPPRAEDVVLAVPGLFRLPCRVCLSPRPRSRQGWPRRRC